MSNGSPLFSSSFLAVTLVIGGALLPGCGNAENEKVDPQRDPARPADDQTVLVLPVEAQQALGAAVKSEPKLLFMFDDKGQLTVFRGTDTNEPTPMKFPVTVDEIFPVTVIKKNPYCWPGPSGWWWCI